MGSSDGNKADGALKLFNGTPFIDLQEDGLVGVIDGQGGDDTITTGDDASFAFGGEGMIRSSLVPHLPPYLGRRR